MQTFYISKKINFLSEGVDKQNLIISVCEKIKAYMLNHNYIEANSEDDKIDFVFSVGGDGTMIHTMNEFLNKDSVVIGINAGNVGFLTPYTIEDVFNEDVFSFIHNESYRIEDRSILQYEYNGKIVNSVNEYAFTSNHPNYTIDFNISIQNKGHTSKAGHYKSNTLLISGPCGSTAYNMNAGGSIIDPSVSVMQILLVAPTTLGIRPMIINSNSKIILRPASQIEVFTDGFSSDIIEPYSTITISMKEKQSKLLVPDNWNFYSVLSKKLLWNNGRDV